MKIAVALAVLALSGCATDGPGTFTPAQLQAQSQFLHEFNQMQRPYYPAGSPTMGTTNCFTTRDILGYSTTCR